MVMWRSYDAMSFPIIWIMPQGDIRSVSHKHRIKDRQLFLQTFLCYLHHQRNQGTAAFVILDGKNSPALDFSGE
ncbi:hypothetical protein AQUCO_00100766v1 [Aquilegia coerulea]|uniref:Uncharacterized protein n=1 Tax=Aquilegia coerulea TaxID=218851 RepID=A0A2G5FC62_AQUCA|nr:hypothetical protein AQUCO_00100766v1 [Aquilegia coerulea]